MQNKEGFFKKKKISKLDHKRGKQAQIKSGLICGMYNMEYYMRSFLLIKMKLCENGSIPK